MYCIGDSIVSTYITKKAKFSLTLPLGHEYKIRFTAPDYLQKIILIDSRNDTSKGGWEFLYDIQLEKMLKGFSPEILEIPVAKWQYNPEIENYFFHREYHIERQALHDNEIARLKQNKR
jgi:hypothetical protein